MRSQTSALLRLAPVLLAAACGAGPAPSALPATTVVASAPPADTAAIAPPAAPLGPLDPSLPAGSAALASIDLGKLDELSKAALATVSPADRATLEEALHLAAGALADGRVSRAVGIDPARPMVASFAVVGPAKAAIDRLRALAGKPGSDGRTDDMRRALDGATGLGAVLRVVVPTTDSSTAMGVASALLEEVGFAPASHQEGIDELYAHKRRDVLAGLSRGPSQVVIDLVFPATVGAEGEAVSLARSAEVLSAVRARAPGGPHDEPAALDGAVARARYTPAALADVSFLGGVVQTLRALAQGSDNSDTIAAAGLKEAAQVYPLVAGTGGAHFDRIELWIDGGYGSLGLGARATLGPGTRVAEAAWAPTPSITFPSLFATLDVSLPWVRSWAPLLDDPFNPRPRLRQMREAGWGGYLVALPQLLASGAFDPMRWFSHHPGVLPHLERVGIYTLAERGGDSHFAVLPAGTSAAAAACALVEPPEPCTAEKKLRVGAVTSIDGRFAKLLQLKGRWVILLGSDKAELEKSKPELVVPPPGPVRLDLPGGPLLAREFRPLPSTLLGERYLGEVALEGGQMVARIRPVLGASKPAAPPKKR